MPELFCNKIKTAKSYALTPAHQTDEEALKGLPTGQPLRVKITRMRNVQFLRKYFALLNYLYDIWEPDEANQVGEKNFSRFRSDMTILAGFYESYIRIDGSTRIEPRSISFSNMSEDDFTELYNKTIDAGVKYVAKNYTGDELAAVVSHILEFD